MSLVEEINAQPLADTHEHLVEEVTRVQRRESPDVPCFDAALLFRDYVDHDLAVAGMPAASIAELFSAELEPDQKWTLVEPYFPLIQYTGAAQAVRLTAAELFGEPILNRSAFRRMSEQMASISRGYYQHVLDVAGVPYCQVNSLEAVCCETEYPELLLQDICITWLTREPDLDGLALTTGIRAHDLAGMHTVIDWFFERFGTSAVAVKMLSAYHRRLNFQPANIDEVAPLFRRYANGDPLTEFEIQRIDDHLTDYCLDACRPHDLPVKIHCGILDGHDSMSLGAVALHGSDVSRLIQRRPDNAFVLMHMGFPYQHEFLALAKHFSNAVVDLSWSWLASPAAAVRFVEDMLMTAPSTKLLPFGGDYRMIEPIVGHARMARKGIGVALTRLVEADWITESAAVDLVPKLMNGNAAALFPRARELSR